MNTYTSRQAAWRSAEASAKYEQRDYLVFERGDGTYASVESSRAPSGIRGQIDIIKPNGSMDSYPDTRA